MRKRCVACGLLEAAAANCTISRCPGQFQRTAKQTLTAAEAKAVTTHRKAQARYVEKHKDDPAWREKRRRIQSASCRKYRMGERGRQVQRRAQSRWRKRSRRKIAAIMKEYNSRPEIKARKATHDRARREIGEIRLMDILWNREKRAQAAKQRQSDGMLPEMLLMAILWMRERKAAKRLRDREYQRRRKAAQRALTCAVSSAAEDMGYAIAD